MVERTGGGEACDTEAVPRMVVVEKGYHARGWSRGITELDPRGPRHAIAHADGTGRRRGLSRGPESVFAPRVPRGREHHREHFRKARGRERRSQAP